MIPTKPHKTHVGYTEQNALQQSRAQLVKRVVSGSGCGRRLFGVITVYEYSVSDVNQQVFVPRGQLCRYDSVRKECECICVCL